MTTIFDRLRDELDTIGDRVKDAIVNRLGGSMPEGEMTTIIQQLSDRELEVFQLIGQGEGTRQIAVKLHLSMKTVSCYRQNIKTKLNLQNASQLVSHAVHWATSNQMD